MIAPLVALTYPLDKLGDSKSQAFNIWFKEYLMNAIIQPVHLILYTVLISSAMDLAVKNPLYALVAIGFLIPAEKFIKKLFGFDKAETPSGLGAFAGGALTMKGVVVRDLEAGGKMPTSFDGYQQIKAGNLLMCLFDIDVTPRCIGLICNNGVTSPAYSQFIMKKNAYAPFYSYYYLMVDFTKELLHMAKNLRHSLNEEQFGAILAPVPPI